MNELCGYGYIDTISSILLITLPRWRSSKRFPMKDMVTPHLPREDVVFVSERQRREDTTRDVEDTDLSVRPWVDT